jgi:uncharacterized protein YndB with AHSA1/START domain
MDALGQVTGLRTPSEREFKMTHVFDAPREEVFKMTIDPALIPQWWGPRRLTTIVDKMDVRPGGEWRFIQHDSEGKEYAFHGTYQEIDRPNRLVYTFEYEDMPGDVMVETVVFEEVDGKTRLDVTDLFPSQESRDASLKAGMEAGAAESMERFAELLATATRV